MKVFGITKPGMEIDGNEHEMVGNDNEHIGNENGNEWKWKLMEGNDNGN